MHRLDDLFLGAVQGAVFKRAFIFPKNSRRVHNIINFIKVCACLRDLIKSYQVCVRVCVCCNILSQIPAFDVAF